MIARPAYLWALAGALGLFVLSRTQQGQVAIAGASDAIGGAVRGIRNNNPGNIRRGADQWEGMSASQTDGAFVQFDSMAYGIRALAVILRNYQARYNVSTVRQIVNRWAPSSENDTGAYIDAVSMYADVGPADYLNLSDGPTLFLIVRAIIRQEIGAIPAALVSDTYVNAGISLALG